MVRYITEADVADGLDWLSMTEALAEGHRQPKAEVGDTLLTRGPDALLSRAAWIDGQGIAVKSMSVVPANTAAGLPSIQGAMVLFEDRTGQVEAVLDGVLVTKWKTAADSLLGARLLANPQPRSILLVGAGTVARSLVEGYRRVFGDVEISVWNRTPRRAQTLAAATGIDVAEDLEAAVRAADIISCATMSKTPIIDGTWLSPGCHLDLIGAFSADMREADDTCLRRGRLFVDSRDTTLGHIGEVMIPIAAGVIGPEDIQGDLYDLVAGRSGRAGPQDITIFKNGGGAHLDLMTGKAILAAVQGPA